MLISVTLTWIVLGGLVCLFGRSSAFGGNLGRGNIMIESRKDSCLIQNRVKRRAEGLEIIAGRY